VDRGLVSELEKTAFSIFSLSDLISKSEEISLLVNANLVMAKVFFF
jgi:hypothetical protein